MATENTKVILSSGYGRLHLAQSADWLGKVGVAVDLVCGWVPRNANSILVKLCSKIVGRDLSAGLRKRLVKLGNGGRVCSCTWIDFFCNFLNIAERKITKGKKHDKVMTFLWQLFGWHTKKYLQRGAVFHVRSGAGHGGAIRKAKKLSMPVVVDHSIAHPAFMEQHLRGEFERNGARFDLGTDSSFWRMIVEDCEWADALLVNSFFVRDTFLAQGYPAEKIKVVYLGTRPDFFGLRKHKTGDKIKLLFTGGFGFRKGAEYILDALEILKQKAPLPFEMDVVGDFSGGRDIIEKHKSSNLPIRFHGPVPQDDLKQFLAAADIYVFPSLAEGCACSGMEAMAAGLCVVATHESGLPIEDNVTGIKVPSKNAQAVADKILHLMNNPTEIDRLGHSAAELIATKYTWQQYAENLKQIYQELLEKTVLSGAGYLSEIG